MDGILFMGCSFFFYFVLVVFEVGGILSFFFLFLVILLVGFLYYYILEFVGICVFIFVMFVGMKVFSIELVVCVVLLKFYSSDLYFEMWRVFLLCGSKCVLMVNFWIMVEVFLKEYLGVDLVIGMEMLMFKGSVMGFVVSFGIFVGKNKVDVF